VVSAGRPGSWLSAGRRVGAAGLLGTAVGWFVSLDLDWSSSAARQQCAGSSGSVCFGLAVPEGLVFGALVVLGAIWFGFAVTGIRPLLLTVPVGLLAGWLLILIYLHSVPGGRLHPAWLFAVLNGALFALLAAAAAVYSRDQMPHHASRDNDGQSDFS
jgi:hypothetical protein